MKYFLILLIFVGVGFFTVNAQESENCIPVDIEYTSTDNTQIEFCKLFESYILVGKTNSISEGSVTIEVPRKTLDAVMGNCEPEIFFTLINNNEVKYNETITPSHRIIEMNLPKGNAMFEIIGTNTLFSPHPTLYCGASYGYNSQYAPPLKQINAGMPLNKIRCNESLVLLQKYDGTPACVTESTKQKLIERGWTGNNTQNKSSDSGQLKGVLNSCACQERVKANPNTIERCPSSGHVYQNSTHYIDNNSCRWIYLEKYLNENNELNFAQPYDNNGMIIDDLQRIYDWCDYSGDKPDWYFSWNNQTHHIDSSQCKWYGCDDGEIYYRGVCMTPEAKEKAQSVGEFENEN